MVEKVAFFLQMEMYQFPCHNSLEPITSIITIIREIVLTFMHQLCSHSCASCAHIHVPVGTTEASYKTFGYRGIYIWNHISQKIT